MAEEEVATATATATASPAPLDLKRKHEDLEAEEEEEEAPREQTDPSESNGGDFDSAASDEAGAKRPRLDGELDASASENGHQEENNEEPVKENDDDQPQLEEVAGEVTDEQPLEVTREPSIQNVENTEEQENQSQPSEEDRQEDYRSTEQEQPPSDDGIVTRRMEIPNNKVGVLIGKSGETIRYLQYNSGAKIQITKDVDTDPHSTTRPVEMVGTLESVKKAEKLINAVIAEAEAGGSPSLVARGHGASQAASEQIEMQVPNEKVGVIIGKGGETIKGLQTRSGARIQLIPQHLNDGDESKERTVRVTGDKRQIELAREMIKDVMNQPSRQSHSGGFNQQGYRPRGPPGPHHWGGGGGPRGHHMGGHQNSYDYQQRGQYSSHNQQYPPPYRGYPQPMGPRGSSGGYNSSGWEQRPPPPSMNQHSGGGGYDYYGGHKGYLPEHGQHSGPPPSMNQPPHSQGNYNYGQNQNQGPDYGHHHQGPYSQPPHQQGYGYDDHSGSQHHRYGSSQPYQHTGPSSGYGPPPPQQQQYTKPPYSTPPPPQSYQTPPPQQQPYGQNPPPQQLPYAYALTGPTQQSYPSYGSAPDGYGQVAVPPPQQASGYPQQGVQAQPTAAYAQGGPTASYAQYPSQQGYADPNSAGYGYQDPAAYGTAPATSAAVVPTGQTVYSAQATTVAAQAQAQQSYDPTGTGQQAYGVSQPIAATAAYGAKTVSPQPQPQPQQQTQTGYAQYDSAQMYAAPH